MHACPCWSPAGLATHPLAGFGLGALLLIQISGGDRVWIRRSLVGARAVLNDPEAAGQPPEVLPPPLSPCSNGAAMGQASCSRACVWTPAVCARDIPNGTPGDPARTAVSCSVQLSTL